MPNKKYSFRVCAVNEAGNSEWSDGSDLIEAKNPEVEPSIDESLLPKQVNAIVGEDFKITIPYKGGPIKTAQFTKVLEDYNSSCFVFPCCRILHSEHFINSLLTMFTLTTTCQKCYVPV